MKGNVRSTRTPFDACTVAGSRRILYVAAKLGLPDMLAAGIRIASELATATSIEARPRLPGSPPERCRSPYAAGASNEAQALATADS
jgi:hypothetical protein